MKNIFVFSFILFYSSHVFATKNAVYFNPSDDSFKEAKDSSAVLASDYEYGSCYTGDPDAVFDRYFEIGETISDFIIGEVYQVKEYKVDKSRLYIDFYVYNDDEEPSESKREAIYIDECSATSSDDFLQ